MRINNFNPMANKEAHLVPKPEEPKNQDPEIQKVLEDLKKVSASINEPRPPAPANVGSLLSEIDEVVRQMKGQGDPVVIDGKRYVKDTSWEPMEKQQEAPMAAERVTNAEVLMVAGFVQEMLEFKGYGTPEQGKACILEMTVREGEDRATHRPKGTRIFQIFKSRNYQNYQLTAFKTAVPEGMARTYELNVKLVMGNKPEGGPMEPNSNEEIFTEPPSKEIPTEQQVADGSAPDAAECLTAARQLQKYIEQKPFEGGGDFFMEGLVRHGELEVPKDISPTLRAWRAVKRLEMKAEHLKPYGFNIPDGMKRVYQLEVSLVCDTVPDDVMSVNDNQTGNNSVPLGTEKRRALDEQAEEKEEEQAFKAGQEAGQTQQEILTSRPEAPNVENP